ncbi:hypothetical protein CIHG_06104 [Coccidioides immitis H538.4]|uniref:Uncharacterized protein n=3 Tax=Coccidioides immitis TaxID=5501 RepID=A0A0J8RBD1_COCIT|nr:hypothetical protein CIRG_00045 [Coccidioides immitis RMSCC 2394]KMU82126.1 hypothetical protein CISG_09562 [Coccidioides immitis RMSCC 3703]KMU88306.1 hypothetical protein CIHG_06104 [Coccidioides immitis H538.4]
MPAAHHQPFHRQATELKHAHRRRLCVWTTLLAVRTEFYICSTPAVAQTKNVDCRGTGLVTRSRNLTGYGGFSLTCFFPLQQFHQWAG